MPPLLSSTAPPAAVRKPVVLLICTCRVPLLLKLRRPLLLSITTRAPLVAVCNVAPVMVPALSVPLVRVRFVPSQARCALPPELLPIQARGPPLTRPNQIPAEQLVGAGTEPNCNRPSAELLTMPFASSVRVPEPEPIVRSVPSHCSFFE